MGALLDLGADAGHLREELKKLPAEGYELRFGRRKVRGIDAFDFDVILAEQEEHTHSHHHRTHERDPGDSSGFGALRNSKENSS